MDSISHTELHFNKKSNKTVHSFGHGSPIPTTRFLGLTYTPHGYTIGATRGGLAAEKEWI